MNGGAQILRSRACIESVQRMRLFAAPGRGKIRRPVVLSLDPPWLHSENFTLSLRVLKDGMIRSDTHNGTILAVEYDDV